MSFKGRQLRRSASPGTSPTKTKSTPMSQLKRIFSPRKKKREEGFVTVDYNVVPVAKKPEPISSTNGIRSNGIYSSRVAPASVGSSPMREEVTAFAMSRSTHDISSHSCLQRERDLVAQLEESLLDSRTRSYSCDTVDPAINNFDKGLDTASRTPSYTKISCALSGYRNYRSVRLSSLSRSPTTPPILCAFATPGGVSSGKPPLPKSMVEMRRDAFNRLSSEGSSPAHAPSDASSPASAPLVNNSQNPSPKVKDLITGFDKLHVNDSQSPKPVGDLKTTSHAASEPPLPAEALHEQKPLVNGTADGDCKLNGFCENGESPAGEGFLRKLEAAEISLDAICVDLSAWKGAAYPEEAVNEASSISGKSGLLKAKRMNKFRQLCLMNMGMAQNEEDSEVVVLNQDLVASWDILQMELDPIRASYENLCKARDAGWADEVVHAPREAKRQPKSGTTTPTARSRPSSADSKLKNEARERLRMAKAAMRAKQQNGGGLAPDEDVILG